MSGEYSIYKYKPPRKLENGYPTDNLIKSLSDLELLRYMDVPPKYWDDVVHREAMSMPLAVVDWAQNLPSIYRPLPSAPNKGRFGQGLIFYGEARSGKTTHAARLLLHLVRLGIHNNDPGGYNRWDGWCMGRFVDWQEASAVFRAGFSSPEAGERAEALRNSMMSMGPMLEQANFLVIDDLTRERGTEFNVSELARIVRYRGDHGYPTIITTNHTPDEWESRYSEFLSGYLHDMFLPVQFEIPS